MVFSSSFFMFFFLPIVLFLYYFLYKLKFQNVFLLIASLVFYAWGEPKFVFVIIASILINYIFGLFIGYSKKHFTQNINKIMLLIGVAANCGLLFYFKYFDFAISSINEIGIFSMPIALKGIILPIGISFFTFQGLSYIIDLYLGKVDVQKDFIKFALFKALFPQLIAGPIVRYVDVHDQIDSRQHSVEKFAEGVRRFIYGLAKKALLANTLGLVADGVFGVPVHQNSTGLAWVGIICYSLQIYFDFSGYSDMAIGLAKMFGFDFKENFNYPYISRSIAEFWRRWHISLSSWFRDYLYIPLGGNRSGNVYVNLFIVFLVTGLWHGAAWNFIVWGVWHGCFIIIERQVKSSKLLSSINLPSFISWIYTMLVVIIGWVLFRSPDLHYAFTYLQIMFGMYHSYDVGFSIWYYLNAKVLFVLFISIISMTPIVMVFKKINTLNMLVMQVLNLLYLTLLFLLSILIVVSQTYNPFIYFRF